MCDGRVGKETAIKDEYENIADDAGVDTRDGAKATFASFLTLAFLLATGLALSIAYLSFSGIAGSTRLDALGDLALPQESVGMAMMTYIGVSIIISMLAAFALIYALGRHLILIPQLALRRSKERLRISEARARRLALVAEKASDIVIIYNRDGKVIWVNAAFEKTTGYLADEVIGRQPGELLNGPKSDPEFAQRVSEAMRNGEAMTGQIVNYSRCGREYLVEVQLSPVQNEYGEVINFIAVERDITTRHMAEYRLKKAIEMLENGFTIFDKDDRLVMFNRAFEEMLGCEGRLSAGMTLAEIAVQLDRVGFIELGDQSPEQWAKDHASRMRSDEKERSISRIDGRNYLIRDLPMENGDVVSVRTDVTELENARRKSEEAMEAKSRFFAGITHEVRTPLNGVIAMAELLLEGDLTEPQRSGLELISQSGSSLLTIINDILDYSRIEVGKLTIQPAPFDIVEAMEDVVALLAPEALKQNNEIAFHFAPDVPHLIKGDHGRIRQIATNLVGNAIKFTSGGEIVVRLEGRTSKGQVELTLAVEDSGVGISPEDLEIIFQPFEQTGGPMRTDGSGLGLSICRQLADLMGGEISATSVPDQGSIFRFVASFPVLDGASATPEPLSGERPVALCGTSPHIEALGAQVSALGGVVTSKTDDAALNIVSLTREGHFPKDMRINKNAPVVLVAPQQAPPPPDMATLFPKGATLLRRPVRTGVLASSVTNLLAGGAQGRRPESERRRKARASEFPLVLVTEDNATNAAIIRAMLADQNMLVEIYADGASAVEAFERRSPAVVLMDIQLPDMTGFDATARMRSIDEMLQKPPTPVIAATASSTPEDQQACLGAGLDDFISKPLNKQQLCTKLGYWIARSQNANLEEDRLIAG